MTDKMQLSRGLLPASVRETVRGLSKGFDPASRASIEKRLSGTFAKLERKTDPPDPGPDAHSAAGALGQGAKLVAFTDARKKKV